MQNRKRDVMRDTKIKVITCGNHPQNKGGITSVIHQILSYDWNTAGIEMHFIPTYYSGNVFIKMAFFAQAYISLFMRFIVDKPDIVHIHMSYKGSFTRANAIHIMCKKFNIRDIVHLHGSQFEKWYNSLTDSKKKKVVKLFDETDAAVVLGNKWSNVIKKIAPNSHIVIINNAVHIPENQVEWNEDFFHLLFMGVLIKRKGIEDLINSIKLLRNSNRIGKIRLTIAGTGTDENTLKNLVKNYKLDEYIEFSGWIGNESKEKYYMNSQAFILPSYNEGLPVSILEAMSYGLPIIATNVGDVADAVLEGKNGYLLNPGDSENLANKIYELSQSKDTFEKMSWESRNITEKYFSESDFFQKIEKLYASLC